LNYALGIFEYALGIFEYALGIPGVKDRSENPFL
jgi:hypothetical protein